ncbi:uncharacterized protein LOC111404696 [Olea europaea var. sylvestris]|uniref:uncharacterized protein LOC111404696 n=1 Tax=Olea europaea var. sylvestris TaxID=158386 RepID=UPI000C1D7FEB|nr:uncharacterized protein LOC111404696 [Olea europaea var. sylvestris]
MEKGPESSRQYPLSSLLNYDKLSLTQRKYTLALSTIYEPKSFAKASQHPDWCQAMDTKYQALLFNNTWDFKLKSDGTKERKKVGLVAKGFTQQAGLDYEETVSPITKLVTVKTLLAVAAQK